MKKIVPWLLCCVLILVSLCLFYPAIATLQAALLSGDHREQHFPWASFLGQRLAQGGLPWWTWKIHCGFPLLAEGQVGALYPPNLILHSLLPIHAAYAIGFLLHMFLSGLFFVLLCRQMQLGWASAALATMAYLYGNAYGGAYYNFTSLKTLCWFPLSVYCIEKLGQAKRLRFAFLLGITFAMALLAGYLQIAVYSIAMSLAYFVFRYFPRQNILPLDGGGQGGGAFSPWYGLLVSVFVMLLLFAPQLLATYPLSQLSARVGLQESFAYIGSYPPWGLVTLFFPKMESLFRTLGVYVGIFPLFLAILSFSQWRDARVRRLVYFLILSLLLAMGGYSPLYVGLVKISGFYGFRVPSKLLFFTNTALAILAGLGLQALMDKAVSKRAWQITKGSFLALAATAIISIVLGGWFLHTFKELILQWGYHWVQNYIYGKPYHPNSLEFYRSAVDSYYRLAKDFFRWDHPHTQIALCTLAAVSLVLLFLRHSVRRSALVLCCLGLTFVDMYAYCFINKMSGDVGWYAKEITRPPCLDYLHRDTTLFRIYGYRGRFDQLSLISGYNMLFDVEDIGAYSPLVTRRYKELLDGLGAVDDSTGRIVGDVSEVMARLPMLSMMNVKYILTKREMVLPGLQEVFVWDDEHIFKNAHAQDRFFFASSIAVAPDSDAVLHRVRQMDFDSMRKIWLEEPLDIYLPGSDGQPRGKIQLTSYSDMQIGLDVETAQDQLLFGSLLFYPGVRAFLDGSPVKIYRANACFCAIRVPQGKHQIIFAFDWKKSLAL